MWSDKERDSRPIPDTKILLLSNLTNNVTRIWYRYYSFILAVKSVINSSVIFEKKDGVSFPTNRMEKSVDNIVYYNFLNGNSRQTYQRNIQVAKLLIRSQMFFSVLR